MQTKSRVVGSGFTTFNFNGVPIAWLDNVDDTGQTPVGQGTGPGWEEVHPLDERYPVEIATSRALSSGQLTLTVRELWNLYAWETLTNVAGAPGILAGTTDMTQVFEALANLPHELTAQMLIKPPAGTALPTRGKTYHNCTVTRIYEGETVQIGALTLGRRLDVVYTHTTKFP